MVGRFMSGWLFLIGLAVWSCSTVVSPSRGVWTATPEFQEAHNQLCSVRIEPRKGEFPYYAVFLLTLENKSQSDLIIDWNECRYLFNGTPQGVLVFEGIDPKSIKSATIPLESVAPGGRFSRELLPMRLVAWNPINEKTANRRSITPGMLPDGKNGIRLVLRHGNGRVTIPLSVHISHAAAP